MIREELATAKAIVVLWSSHSVQSGWVLDDARVGMEREVLVPALIDDSRIPLGFGQIQSILLAQPDRLGTSSSVSTLEESLERLISGEASDSHATEERSSIEPALRSSFLAAGVIAIFIATGFLFWQIVDDPGSAGNVWWGFLIMAPGVFVGAHLALLSEPRRVAVKALGVAAIVGIAVWGLYYLLVGQSLIHPHSFWFIPLIVVWVGATLTLPMRSRHQWIGRVAILVGAVVGAWLLYLFSSLEVFGAVWLFAVLAPLALATADWTQSQSRSSRLIRP